MKSVILGVPVDAVTSQQAIDKIKNFLKSPELGRIVITPNPEVIVEARENPELMKIIKSADLVVPDGIGVVIASKLNKVKLKERVPGCDLVLTLFDYIKDKDYTVYMLGAGKGVAAEAKKKMEIKYPGIKIVGIHDGYFDEDEEKIIINEIKALKPDILLAGLGVPRQEKWIYKYREELPVKISFGVGGTIDVMADKVKRAPQIFRKLGLEWFYRLISQPSRFFRMLRLPKFVILVLMEKAGLLKG